MFQPIITQGQSLRKTGKFCKATKSAFIVYDERNGRTHTIPLAEARQVGYDELVAYHDGIDDSGGVDEQLIARRAAEIRVTWTPRIRAERRGTRDMKRANNDEQQLHNRRDRVLRRLRTRHDSP